MTKYEFLVKIRPGRQKQEIKREVEAESEKHAEEKLLAEIGSEHGISRGQIELEELE